MLISHFLFPFPEGMVDKAKVEEAEGKIYELEQQVSRTVLLFLSLSPSFSLF
jgi:hypothetical protein